MDKSIYSKEYAAFLMCLRETRKSAGITQQQMAEMLGTTQSVISKLERGERRVDVVELRQSCKIMGISLIDFVAIFEASLEDNK